jgi:hypothetical protein
MNIRRETLVKKQSHFTPSKSQKVGDTDKTSIWEEVDGAQHQ